MTTKVFAGKTVQVNEEGFLTNAQEWSREMAVEIAREEGVDALTEAHWKVIDYCRTQGLATGAAPTLRGIALGADISIKELFSLFPKGPAKKVARISGLRKPEGCV